MYAGGRSVMAKLKAYVVSVEFERLWVDVPVKAESLEQALEAGRALKIGDVIEIPAGDLIDFEQRVRGVGEA